jgi:hypothetical protein
MDLDTYAFSKQPGFVEAEMRKRFKQAVPLRTVVVYCYDPRAANIIFGIYTLTLLWPSGWSWHTGHHIPHYLQMILGVYATLGIFLLFASRKPLAHLRLIWFTVWSSVVTLCSYSRTKRLWQSFWTPAGPVRRKRTLRPKPVRRAELTREPLGLPDHQEWSRAAVDPPGYEVLQGQGTY